MRPAQQNRRMRGRGNNNNNNNRKGPNPLSRNYESNGPDVKIRGNAQHIAEKYTALARDAQASGDRVMAENYLQHAEHYNRIIMAAMAQNPVPFQREETFDDDGMDDEETGFAPAAAAEPRPVNGSGPQPVIDGTPAEVIFGEEGGEPVRQNENRQPRESRDQSRRSGRGRRPQRERFNGEEQGKGEEQGRAEQQARSEEQPAVVEAPAAPAAAQEAAPVIAETPAAPAGGEEDAAPRRATRRPGRPRRAAKDQDADGEGPVAETVASDA
ncbi:MAG: DUF4167 domain-containing protein [Rhizobiales bacterium]|nr:DUF4167 domain-containing protein [Hyphomicrobiales bacterium]OJY07249.1 MAG: hypothetical protein BGP07_19305 [Rhizobiales bacterium 63-22]